MSFVLDLPDVGGGASFLLDLLRRRAKGRSVRRVAAVSGVAYSRAHLILRGKPAAKTLANVEALLSVLAPEVLAAILKARDSDSPGD